MSDEKKTMNEPMIIGSLETCDLPDLEISNLNIRVDTGAKTSSLHVDNIEEIKKKGVTYVSFDIHPDVHNVDKVVSRKAPVSDIRRIKSSNGEVERRYVITTLFALGGRQWPIEITLSNRKDMTYLMLLGREGMGDRVLVAPAKNYLVSKGDVDTDAWEEQA